MEVIGILVSASRAVSTGFENPTDFIDFIQKNLSVFVLEYLDAVFIGEVQWDILEIIFVCV